MQQEKCNLYRQRLCFYAPKKKYFVYGGSSNEKIAAGYGREAQAWRCRDQASELFDKKLVFS